ncbi:MAG: ribosomal subunit interface protein [Flavobacteriales bacterium]|nr:MAG: ribosomal subunit interface protein [Flavobacteriales bacterium]
MKVNVHSIHFDADKKLVDYVNKKVNKLDNYFDGIVGGDVYLKLDNSGDKANKITEIKINMPGKELFAKRQNKTFEEAVNSAVEAIRRQVSRYKGKLKTV